MNETVRAKAPLHFWVVAVVAVLWNAFGGVDYTMTMIRDPAYLAQFPPEMIEFLDSFPTWAMAVWALGVWGAVAGSLLLLARSRFAVHAFAVSLAGLAASTVYQQTVDVPPAMQTPGMMAMNLVIWAAALFFLWYSWRQHKERVLG